MHHTHHPVSQSDGVPLDGLDGPLQDDHPEEVGVGEGQVARGGGDVWEGGLGWAGDVEHPAHSLQSDLSVGGERENITWTSSDEMFILVRLLVRNCTLQSTDSSLLSQLLCTLSVSMQMRTIAVNFSVVWSSYSSYQLWSGNDAVVCWSKLHFCRNCNSRMVQIFQNKEILMFYFYIYPNKFVFVTNCFVTLQ